jgi:hypothetical protein
MAEQVTANASNTFKRAAERMRSALREVTQAARAVKEC